MSGGNKSLWLRCREGMREELQRGQTQLDVVITTRVKPKLEQEPGEGASSRI